MIKRQSLILLLLMTGCASILTYNTVDFESLYGPSAPKQRQLTPEEARLSQKQNRISYYKDIKPILDARCVACHGCYDAPCQLQLGSFEGLDRGATKKVVYDTARLSTANPTRLFTDATSTAGWREKDFYPVLNERRDSPVANLDNSILAKLIALKRLNPQPASGKLGKDFDLRMERVLQCPVVEEFPKLQAEHPKWGMPYAMPGLSLKEENTLMQWLQDGAKVGPPSAISKKALMAVVKWENYFNGSSLKEQLVFRYIYEHLFIGHMHFQGHPNDEFFKWVRSKTAPGQPIEEINTVHPYDDPGPKRFYYRLHPVAETIVDKTHFVYELSDQKMKRYNELFFSTDYEVINLPSYEPKVAANPFSAFAKLPYTSKHRFLLDDAEYFFSGFIKGPVCRGEIATDSIRDRFWVVFLQPARFSTEKILKALADNEEDLQLPGGQADQIGLLGWRKYDAYGKELLRKKEAFINSVMPKDQGFDLGYIWDGEGQNQNAALTVFRHFDSATVIKGLVGDTPLTAWVVDYPIFERLHYLLATSYNVFGKAQHQIATRTYMDVLRQDAEDNFLRFMPAKEREGIYKSWYLGIGGLRTADALFSINHESRVKYETTDYKKEFFDQVRKKLGKAAGAIDTINRCEEKNCIRANTTAIQQQVDREMRELASYKGRELDALPEMSLLRIKTGEPSGDLVYTLLLDKAYGNISRMLAQDAYRMPDKDRVTIYPGFLGAYPNFFFAVDIKMLHEFVQSIRQTKTENDKEKLYIKFGIRRTNSDIWNELDWFNAQHKVYRGLEAGLLDMSRYQDL